LTFAKKEDISVYEERREELAQLEAALA